MTAKRTLGLSTEVAQAVGAALRRVLEASPTGIGERGQHLLALAVRELELEGDVLAPASDEALLKALPSRHVRRWLVDVLVVAACIEGRVEAPVETTVTTLARTLGVSSPWVDALPALRKGRTLSLKRALATQSPDARRLLARTLEEDGLLRGGWFIASFLLGLHRDAELAGRYRALETLAPGTLGAAFHHHLTSRGLTFPGERGGVPERMVHHDVLHVLNGYDTDPAGECELAGFYAGLASVHPMPLGDGFTWVVTVLATFHLGLAVSPGVVTTSTLAFDPSRVLAAFFRGRCMCVDPMGPWDLWALFPLPLDEARAALGLATSGS